MKALFAVEGKKNVGEPRWFDGGTEVKELTLPPNYESHNGCD